MALATAAATALLTAATPIDLLEVHGPDGQTSYINTRDISNLRQPTSTDLNRHFTPGVRCIVVMTSGKFIATTEPCQSLKDRMTSTGGGRQRPTPRAEGQELLPQ